MYKCQHGKCYMYFFALIFPYHASRTSPQFFLLELGAIYRVIVYQIFKKDEEEIKQVIF